MSMTWEFIVIVILLFFVGVGLVLANLQISPPNWVATDTSSISVLELIFEMIF